MNETNETKGCKRCGATLNPATWPGSIGYCSGICEALAEIEAAEKRTREMMQALVSVIGGRR